MPQCVAQVMDEKLTTRAGCWRDFPEVSSRRSCSWAMTGSAFERRRVGWAGRCKLQLPWDASYGA
jgi:hypothetical protein